MGQKWREELKTRLKDLTESDLGFLSEKRYQESLGYSRYYGREFTLEDYKNILYAREYDTQILIDMGQ